MRADRLIKMLIFRFGLRFLRKGADNLARPRDADGNLIAKKDMTPEQRARLANTQKTTKGAVRAARIARRFGRF